MAIIETSPNAGRGGITPSGEGARALGVVLLVLVAFGAVLAGVGAGNGDLVLALLPLVLLGVVLLSLYPVPVLWLTLGVALLAAGLAKLYLPALAQVRWLAVPLALILALHVLLAALSSGRDSSRRAASIPILWWAAAVFAVSVLATLLNDPEPMQAARGLKGYFQVWGLLLGLGLLAWPEPMMRRGLPRFLLVVALLQLPFVLHQYLVLVPHRAALELQGLVPVDVIAGTFGAQLDGGGANSLLAAFMFVVLGGLIGLWQNGVLSGRRLLLLGPLLMAPILVNAAKVSLVYAPALFLVLFSRELIARPGRFLGMGAVAAVAVLSMVVAYSQSIEDRQVDHWSEVITFIYQSNVATDQQNRGTFTRAGALRHWWEQHAADPLGAVLGHGLYESRQASAGVDLWDPANPALGIKNTAVSAILWDAGLLGLAAVFGLLISGYFTAARLQRGYHDDPWMAGLFKGAKAAMAILFVSLWVKSYFTYQLAYQTLLVVLLGWLVYWDLRARARG